MAFSYRCSCGQVFTADGDNKEMAVEAIKSQLSEEAVNEHYAQRHPGESVSKAQVDDQITSTTQEGDFSAENTNLENIGDQSQSSAAASDQNATQPTDQTQPDSQ